jgi:crotonobetainyl-CoA:carnitine CoA-transferase CaiB-like acyl-CoA transferase
VRPPTLFAGTPAAVRRHAPVLGQHPEEFLREAGYDMDETAMMKKVGTVFQKETLQRRKIQA